MEIYMITLSHQRNLVASAALPALLVGLMSAPMAAADGVATLGSPAPAEQEVAGAASDDPMDAMLEFAACMRDNGVDMADPQPAGGGGMMMAVEGTADSDGGLDDAFMLAEEACRGHLEAMTSASDPVRDAEIMEQLVGYAECMRDQGIDMADPVMSGGSIRIGAGPNDASGGSGPDPFSDEYLAAEEACRDISPFGGLGDFTGSTP
jgi:hypothetical protein